MAWLRRVNESNVDLNRNCIFDGEYSGAPAGYRTLNSFLNPASPPSFDLYTLRAALLSLRHGLNTLKQSVVGGQYEFPKGLFFGGKQLEKGISGYQDFIRRRMSSIEQLFSIDVHTGWVLTAKIVSSFNLKIMNG